MSKVTLSVCMIVKNEEKYLETCLQSIFQKVEEIIVVDTGSTDSTISIAKKFNTNIFEIEWINDFSYARNFSLQNAQNDWIFVIDADEEILETEIDKIYQLISAPSSDAYQIVIRNLLPEGEIVAYNEQPALRLFKNHLGIAFTGKIHESVQPYILNAGYKVVNSDVFINHYGYTQTHVQGGIARGDRNLNLLLDEVNANQYDPYLHYQLGITYKHLNHLSSAEIHLKKALSFNKKELSPLILSDIFLKLAQIATIKNQPDKCIKYATSSLQYDTHNLLAKYLLSITYAENKRYKQAIPYLYDLLQMDRVSPKDKTDIASLLQFCKSQVDF
jgi:glycosyltransferase involved in cell wall biosynthesis